WTRARARTGPRAPASRAPHDPVRREHAEVRAPPRDHEGRAGTDQGARPLDPRVLRVGRGPPSLLVRNRPAVPARREGPCGDGHGAGPRAGEASRAAPPREGLREEVTPWRGASS